MNTSLKILLLVFAALLVPGCLQAAEKAPGEEDTPINLVRMGGQDMVQRLSTGEIAGFVGWEPWPSIAITEGYGKSLLDSGDIWEDHPCCVVAYDNDWYEDTENADEILNRASLIQMKSVEYINSAKNRSHPDHEELVGFTMEFGGLTNRDAAELSLDNVDFVYMPNIEGTQTFIGRIMDFGIFDVDKWKQSGYQTAEEYANDLITTEYVDWAIQNKDMPLTELALPETVTIRYGYLINDVHELPFYIGWKKGWFDDVGINITLAEGAPFQNGAFQMQKGFKAGAVDIGSLGIPPVIIHRINSNDFTIDDTKVGVISGMNNEGSVIVVANNINSLRDLRGKTVGYPGPGTIQHVLFLMAADKEGLKVSY
ncbi:MAG: ABC transporter substrate-binding protein [Candidatus Methanoperedenaceae archaeon]|nr:ABC transporter substrate-binding protein [Candidatus Methanoperedenaceae archaeon]